MAPFQPITKRSLTDEVFAQLVGGIVAGDLAPGDSLPSERRLAEALGVSRPAVREALQRLAQSRLVDVRQGDGTTVRDFRRTAGPELLTALLLRDGQLDVEVARSIVEVRALLGPQVARLAAERTTAPGADRLDEAVDQMATVTDPVALQREALEFWDALVELSGNVALRLLFNALRGAYEPIIAALAVVLADEVSQLDAYRSVAAAVRAGDGVTAEHAAAGLLEHGTVAIARALATLDSSAGR